MRQAIILCTLVLLVGSAVGQTSIVSGSASNWPPPGTQPVLFVPLVSTPSITLKSPPLTTGASNGTAGNVAGAVNATLSINSNGPSAMFPSPVWSSSPVVEEPPVNVNPKAAGSLAGQPFEFGIATFPSSYGVAGLLALPRQHAARVYTNPDVARVNDTNGSVKYAGKATHLD